MFEVMTKRKLFPPTVNDGYIQTDISTYFKVIRASSDIKMNSQQSTNKENDAEELEPVLSPRKKPKPISSDDEIETVDTGSIIHSSVGPLKNGLSPALVKTPKPVLRENQSPQQCSLTTMSKLPINLPSYTCSSDDSDSDGHGEGRSASQPLRTQINCRTKEPTLKSSQPISRKSSPIKNLKDDRDPILIVDSDDDDFEDTLLPGKKLSRKERMTKVEDFLAYVESNKRKSNLPNGLNDQKRRHVEDKTAGAPGVSSAAPHSTAPAQVTTNSMCINKPTIVGMIAEKPKPRILSEKNKSNANLPSTSAEFISTDFSSNTIVDVLSISIQSTSSDERVVDEQNINFTNQKNINSTPKKVIVLGDVLINSPKTTLQQCNLSPIKKDETVRPIKQNVSSASPRNISLKIKDMTRTNSSNFTKEEFENSNRTTQLFTKIVQYILSHSHLQTMLTGSESEMLNRFFLMPQMEYQFFCFKLFTRIQKWYNIFRLRDELHMPLSDPEMRKLFDCLYENNFVEIDFSKESCVGLLNHLMVKDLKDICETFKIKLTNEKKCEIIEKLLTNCNRQATLSTKSTEIILRDKIKQKMGICVKLNSNLYKLFNKVHLLYSFTTSEFDTPSALHFHLGKIMNKEIYIPTFHVGKNVKVFASIDQFSRFAEAYECKKAMLESFEKKEYGHMLELGELAYTELQEILECYAEPKSSYMMRFTAGYKYTKALSLGAKHLARHYPQKVEEWLMFLIEQDRYCLKQRGTWYDMLVMVQYQYLKQYETAANTLIEALDQKNLSKVSLQDLTHRAEAIKRCKSRKISELLHDKICFVQPASLREWPSIEIDAQVIRQNTGKKGARLQYIKKTSQEQQIRTVEETALEHYFKNGYANGYHCEGSLLTTLLFLLFWDIIYESVVPDAFILEIQYFPLDLMSPEFYTNRKEAIDRRLKDIESKWPYDHLKNVMLDTWNKHAHEKSYINDGLVEDPEDLFNIVLCIGRVKLAQMLERIVKDFKAYHSGLPDLFVWSVARRKCKFIEVKSDKDKLSSKQKLWLDFLLSVGAEAEVCHVHAIGSRTARKLPKKEVKKTEVKKAEANKKEVKKKELKNKEIKLPK